MVNFKKSLQQKEKEKILKDLSLVDHNTPSTHMIFLDNEEEVADFNPSEYFNTEETLLKNKTNRMTKEQLETIKVKIKFK